jgi:cobalt-zinc-cadmium efflux system outer membrane protein
MSPVHTHSYRAPWRTLALAAFVLSIHTPGVRAQAVSSARPALTLRALLDSVRVNHPALFAANSRVRAARGSRISAGVFGNPTVAYLVDQTPFPGSRPLAGVEREAMTTVTLPLEFLYQRGAKVARADAGVRAAEADARAARQRVALDAAAAFYRAGLAEIQSAVTRDLLGWLDTLLAYNRARVEEGVAAEADLVRSRLERDRAGADAAMQLAERFQARAALETYLPPGSLSGIGAITLDAAPMSLPSAAQGDRAAAPTGFDARAEVRAARERLAESNAAVASERSMLVRQVGATIGTMQTGHTTSMIAGVSLPLPLFDQNRGEVQRAGAERDAAAFELAAQQRAAAADLRGALDAARILTEGASRLAGSDSSGFLARADESRRIALGAYREGAVPLFQVIDAARSWSEARMTYYKTIVAQHQSILSLLVAQGRDLYAETPEPTSIGGPPR